MQTPTVFYCFLCVCFPAGLSFSQVGFLVMVGGGCSMRDCLKSCVLYIESDGAGDPALSPADWPALGDHARGLSTSCVDTLIPPLRRSSEACTPPPLTAGWVGPTCSVGGGTAGRGGFYHLSLLSPLLADCLSTILVGRACTLKFALLNTYCCVITCVCMWLNCSLCADILAILGCKPTLPRGHAWLIVYSGGRRLYSDLQRYG